MQVSASAQVADNRNDTPGIRHDLDDRQFAVHAVYTASDRLLLSGGYNYLQLNSATDIVFFTLARLRSSRSLYETKTHAATAEVQVPAGPRLDFRFGYQYIEDKGLSLPLRMHAPRAGFQLKLHRSIAAEGQWQHCSYGERLFSLEGYRAYTIAAGLRFNLP